MESFSVGPDLRLRKRMLTFGIQVLDTICWWNFPLV